MPLPIRSDGGSALPLSDAAEIEPTRRAQPTVTTPADVVMRVTKLVAFGVFTAAIASLTVMWGVVQNNVGSRRDEYPRRREPIRRVPTRVRAAHACDDLLPRTVVRGRPAFSVIGFRLRHLTWSASAAASRVPADRFSQKGGRPASSRVYDVSLSTPVISNRAPPSLPPVTRTSHPCACATRFTIDSPNPVPADAVE